MKRLASPPRIGRPGPAWTWAWLGWLATAACGEAVVGEESACTPEQHCEIRAGVARCATGYTWADPDNRLDLRCVALDACAPESDQALCEAHDACGAFTLVDRCGSERALRCACDSQQAAHPSDNPGAEGENAPDQRDPASPTGKRTRANPRLVFTTRQVFSGDLGGAADASTGLIGADRLCQRAADTAGLPGTFRAFISGWAEEHYYSALERITGDGPWWYPSKPGENSAEAVQTLAEAAQQHFWLDERGEYITHATPYIWTGALDPGRPTCAPAVAEGNRQSWSTNSRQSSGIARSPDYRSPPFELSCDTPAHLICFQSDH